ncbi:MAG: PAS domain S-box protein [Elainellaceae cyanobacterium]
MRDLIIVSSDTVVMEAIAQMDSAQMDSAQMDSAQKNPGVGPSPEAAADAANDSIDDRHVRAGCVLVVDGGRYVGMLSERDIVRLVAQRRPLDTLSVDQVMDRSDIALRESDMRATLAHGAAVIGLDTGDRTRYLYLPVLNDQGYPIGLVARRDTEHRRAEAQLQRLIAGTAATTGQDFFPALTQHIAETLEVSHVVVTEQTGQNLHVLACYINGMLQPEFSYHVASTPCERVLQNGSFYCDSLVQQTFPEDVDLVEMGVESYLGVSLRNSSGKTIGTLCILDEQPIRKPERAEQILRVFAARAAAELERQRATSSLERLNQQLEAKVEERTAALQEREQFLQTILDTLPIPVNWKDRNSVYLGCNQQLANILGFKSPAEIVGKTDFDIVVDHSEAMHFRADDRDVMESGKPKLGIEEPLTVPGDDQRWLVTNKAPLRDLTKTVFGVVVTIQDITERKRAESTLQDSERRFRCAIADAPFPIMIHAEDGEVLQVSATWTDITGYTHDDIPTTSAWVYLAHGDRAPAILEVIRETYSLTARRDNGEFAIATRDGSQRVWLITSTPLVPLPDGRRVTMAMAVDITTRRQAELALRESEERYRTIYNQAAMGLLSTTPNGEIADANPCCCEMLGYSREELLSKTVEDITHPDDRKTIKLASQQRHRDEATSFFTEKRYLRKDGSAFWAATGVSFLYDATGQFRNALAIIRDISERKRYEAERKQAEAHVHALLKRTQLLNCISSEIRDSLDLGIILRNLVNGVVAELSVESCVFAWYRGSNSSELSSHLLEAVEEKKVGCLQSCIGTYTYADCPDMLEHILNNRIYRIEGLADVEDEGLLAHLKSVGLSTLLGLPIHTAGGKIGSIFLGRVAEDQPWQEEEVDLFQSIADQVAIAIYQAQLYEESQAKTQALEQSYRELQEAQIHMVQAEKMSSLGQLVAGIAHEINNPVGFISGNLAAATNYVNSLTALVQRYQNLYPNPPQAIAQLSQQADINYILEDFPKLLSSMENGATRIQAIVQSLRTFSRLEQVGQSAVDIHQRIDNTLIILQNRLNGRAGAPEVEVVKQYGNLPQIECYGSLLDQVFINLLVNAVDAIEERQADAEQDYAGRIAIATEVTPEAVSISIRDNGIGMDAKTQASIFNPFFTTKPIGVGTGMGLSISYQIVAGSHQGKFHCRSTAGEGTEFVVEIPRSLNAPAGPRSQ